MKSIPRYEYSTFPRELMDFPVSDGRAQIASKSGLINLEGYDRIGKPTGTIVELATGYQTLHLTPPGEFLKMRLYGNGMYGTDEAYHHFTYEWGTPGSKTKVMIDHLCHAAHLDIDCGCNHTTEHALHEVFGEDDESGIYLNVDGSLPKSVRDQVARDMLCATGADVSQYIQSTPTFEHGCLLNDEIVHGDKNLGEFIGQKGSRFYWTNDIPVSFLGGNPGRLLVIKEPRVEDHRGYSGKQKLHQVLLYGDVTNPNHPPLLRPHSSCTTAEYGGNACDCEDQQRRTEEKIVEKGSGIFILMEDEGMGSGLGNKLWQTQQTIAGDTDLLTSRERFLGLEGDSRTYEILSMVREITGSNNAVHASNNHTKKSALEQAGIEIVEQVVLGADGGRYSRHAQADFIAKQRSGNYSNYLNY